MFLLPAVPAGASFAANTGALAFRSMRDGNAQIYVSATDGSGAVNLSRSASQEMDPAWSPDGTRLAFVKTLRAGGRPDLFIMNADGNGGARLTANDARGTAARMVAGRHPDRVRGADLADGAVPAVRDERRRLGDGADHDGRRGRR